MLSSPGDCGRAGEPHPHNVLELAHSPAPAPLKSVPRCGPWTSPEWGTQGEGVSKRSRVALCVFWVAMCGSVCRAAWLSGALGASMWLCVALTQFLMKFRVGQSFTESIPATMRGKGGSTLQPPTMLPTSRCLETEHYTQSHMVRDRAAKKATLTKSGVFRHTLLFRVQYIICTQEGAMSCL